MQTRELEAAADAWLREHAPEHRGHHVQIGGDGVLCHSCPGVPNLADDPHAVEFGMLAVA